MLLTWTRVPGSFWPLQGGTTPPLPPAEPRRNLGLPADQSLSFLQLLPRLRSPRRLPQARARLLAPQSRARIREKQCVSDARRPPACGWGLGYPRPRGAQATPLSPPPAPPTYVTSGPAPARPPPSALLPLAVREALRLSCRRRRRSRPLSRVSAAAAATAGDIRGSLIGLAPCLSRRFRPSPAAVFGRGLPAADALEASVLVLLPSPRVLEKRPRPGNGASRFQR